MIDRTYLTVAPRFTASARIWPQMVSTPLPIRAWPSVVEFNAIARRNWGRP